MFNILDGNYKGRLLEIAVTYFGVMRPQYFHFEYGPHHAKVFRCICIFRHNTSLSEGRTKVEAEQLASQKMLIQIQKFFIKRNESEWIFSTNDEKLYLSPEIVDKIGDLKTDSRFDLWSFYGDAVLRHHIARYLFDQYSHFREGLLTRLINEALHSEVRASMAREFSIEKYVRTESTPKILAETLSAVIGKLASLACESVTKDLVMQYYRPFLDRTVAGMLEELYETKDLSSAASVATKIHNFKNELLEYAQKNNLEFPIYSMISKKGAEHDPLFTVQCIFDEHQSIGSGKTMKSAEQEASEKMLKLLHEREVASTRIIKKSTSYIRFFSRLKIFKAPDLRKLKSSIGWKHFESLDNIILAFTHPSQNSEDNYQRLEFLGDAILRKIMIDYIIKIYPDIQKKSDLALAVDYLVSADTQAKIAERLKLGEHLFTLSQPPSPAVLSDVLEALIATIYLDFEAHLNKKKFMLNLSDSVIITWFLPEIQNILGKAKKNDGAVFLTEENFPLLPLSRLAKHNSSNAPYSAAMTSSTQRQNNTQGYSSLFKEQKPPILENKDSMHLKGEDFPRLPCYKKK